MPTELKEKYPFSVDSWTTLARRKRHHFLTHAHSDHTGGIESFADRSIYCSDSTSRLILRRFPKLYASRFIILEMGESKLVQDEEQPFTVTALDANHCPGALMLLFEGDFGNVLHTGDCRLTEDCLRDVLGKCGAQRSLLDCVFLDCTFGKEHLRMPSKTEASLQVRQCILDHPQAPIVYLASDMLGLEELWSDLAEFFNTKIYVDKDAIPDYFADLKIVAPELVTDDPQSTRFHICDGSPFLYQRAKVKFMRARTMRLPEPLFIRPSAQYYTFGERLEGAGCGMILEGSFRKSSVERRHLREPKAAERDEYGIWHVCYTIHSCRSELERAMELLCPKEVISTTPQCHASEVVSKRAGFHHVDVSSLNVRVRKVQQQKERRDAAGTHNVKLRCEVMSSPSNFGASRDIVSFTNSRRDALSSPTNSRSRKKAYLEEKKPEEDYLAKDFFVVVPLFGMARHHIPPSPPVSSGSTDSLQNQEFEDSQSSVECLGERQEGCSSGKCDAVLKTCVEERQEGCPLRNREALLDYTNVGVSMNAVPERLDDAVEILSRQNTESLFVTTNAECRDCQLDELVEKENVCVSKVMAEKKLESLRSNDFKDATRKLYRSFRVPIPSPLPSLLDLYKFD